MKQIISALILTLVFTTTVFSQSSVYEVKGKGTRFYVGGSIHILREQDYPLPKEFDKAFDNSEILVLETDLTKMEDPAIAQKLLGKTMYQDDRTLKTVLSEEVYNELKTACASYGISIDNMGKLKPSMVIMTLTIMELQKLGVASEGVDKHYLNKALKTDRSLLYLETIDEQMSLIAGMGEGNEDEFVLHSLKDLKENSEIFEELIDTWKDGTAKPMLKQIKEFKTDYPELYESLLVDRNNNWIPQMEGYMETKEVEFVVVGALHLYGSDGVLQQLKDKGYKVQQLQ